MHCCPRYTHGVDSEVKDERENPGKGCIYKNKMWSSVNQEDPEPVVTSVTEPLLQSTNPFHLANIYSRQLHTRPQADFFTHTSFGHIKNAHFLFYFLLL